MYTGWLTRSVTVVAAPPPATVRFRRKSSAVYLPGGERVEAVDVRPGFVALRTRG